MLMITALAIAFGAVAQEARPERTQTIIATQETPAALNAAQDGRWDLTPGADQPKGDDR